MLFRATPLVMTGLSVALGQKAGLFNIGAPGQYLMGTCASLCIALGLPVQGSELTNFLIANGAQINVFWPAWLVWILAFLGGMMAGAIWGAIPGVLKALLNINEVLACIMTNWIAANVVTWVFDVTSFKNLIEGNKDSFIYKTSFNNVATPKLGMDRLFPGSQVNGGIIITILFAVLVWVLLNKTTKGYELKACGHNRYAARYAGIRDGANIIQTMAMAGALAAAGGTLYYLAGNTELSWQTYQSLPGEGFNGIPVALLAANNPLGVIFTAMFFAMLNICGGRLSALTSYNEYITNVIIAVIVYLAAFSLVIRMWISSKEKKAHDNPVSKDNGKVKTANKKTEVNG